MPLRVLAGPGCDAVGKDAYLEDELEDGDVVISVSRIFKALTGAGSHRSNPRRYGWRSGCGRRRFARRAKKN